MESALPLVTRLLNKTGHAIGFSVEEGSCPIPSLGPHGRRLVNLSEIINICRRRRSTSWLINVLIDQKLTGMTLKPRNFFEYVQILFKFEINEEGKLIIIAEGIKEKNIDILFRLSWNIGFLLGRNIFWNRRKYVPIADSLLVFPMSMQQKRVRNMCGDAAVVPEAIVNSNKRSPPRKEESPQTESDHSMKHIEVNPSKRKEKGLDLGNDTDDLIQSKNVASPERKTNATYTPLDGSKHDTFEIRMSNSSQTEPFEREGNDPDFHHHRHYYHYQQQLTEHMEYEQNHPPHSSHVPNKDNYDRIFLFGFALLLVVFVHILLLGYKFTH